MSLSQPGLDREAADRALKRLGEESDRIAEALVAMDGHPGHQLLRTATLTGVSQRRWAEASTAMATLWEQFEAYRTLLDRARTVRARRTKPAQAELEELTDLLTGQVVELNQEQAPIERRSLTGPALIIERISLADLVNRMKATYATVTAVLAEADSAASAALRCIDPLDSELHSIITLAGSLGYDPAALHRLRDRLAAARELVAADPLGFAANDPLTRTAADLAGIRAAIAELTKARDTFDDQMAELSVALTDIETTQAESRRVNAVVLAKIANPGLPAIVDPTPALRVRLTGLATLRSTADWTRLAGELGRLEVDVVTALEMARAQLGMITGLLDRRAELRGRLDAYRAKAARLGRAEDLELSALHGVAHDLLYTSPCDLPAATKAVNRYQQAVQEGSR